MAAELSRDKREPRLTREQTIAAILGDMDNRLWQTANDDYQLRLRSRFEVEAVRAALEAPSSASVPQGWKLVPVEPDELMLVAARDWSQAKYGKPVGNDGARGCYKAMLAAAPSHEGTNNAAPQVAVKVSVVAQGSTPWHRSLAVAAPHSSTGTQQAFDDWWVQWWSERQQQPSARNAARAAWEVSARSATGTPRATRRVYRIAADGEYQSYLAARFDKAASGFNSFEWEGHRWRYEYSDFDEHGDFDLLLGATTDGKGAAT